MFGLIVSVLENSQRLSDQKGSSPMKKKIVLALFTISCLFSQEVLAQKIKYKDLFPLLNSKNYALAEPLLKTFIKNEPEHANAHFQMAMLYDYKANKADVLKEKALLNSYIDSAILFYNKATTMITEKELKKNEEFYQAYNRRDLRTGKFEIKVSDVHLEIEKAVKNLENRRTGAQGLNNHFEGLKRNYKASSEIYNGFTEAYPDINKFYLRSDAQTLEKLNQIVQLFDSVHFYQKAYVESLASVKTSYKQSFVYEDVEGFSSINVEQKDFYSEEVKIDDFGDWASKSLGVIATDITRLRTSLIEYYDFIEATSKETGRKGFSIERADLVRKYSNNTYPIDLLNIKSTKADLDFFQDTLLSKMPIGIMAQGAFALGQVEGYNEVDSLAANLEKSDLETFCIDHAEFISAKYKGCLQLQEYIAGIRELAKSKIAYYDSISNAIKKREQWSITGADSLALFAGKAATSTNTTIGVAKLAHAHKQLVIGVKPNSKKGSNVFLALVSSDYTNEWFAEIDTKGSFELSSDSQGAALMEGQQETYLGAIYSKDVNGTFKTCLISTDAMGKLKWYVNHSFPFAITKIEPSTEIAGYKLFAGDGTFVLVDPAGKIRQ